MAEMHRDAACSGASCRLPWCFSLTSAGLLSSLVVLACTWPEELRSDARATDDVTLITDMLSPSNSSLTGHSVARLYMGSAITAFTCFELRVGDGGAETMTVVVASNADGVHFFHLMPPAGEHAQ